MSVFTKKEIILLLIGGILSVLSCVFRSDGGESGNISTPASMAISAVYIAIASTLSLDQQLMFVALALPNTKALGFGGISCSIIICAIAVLKNFSKIGNKSQILLISFLYLLYSTLSFTKSGDIMMGIVMPIKMVINLLFFYVLASNIKIASNSFVIGFKSAVSLLVGIISAFWISLNQSKSDSLRAAVEGNDPNILAIECAFVIIYLCVYYYNVKSFSKLLLLGCIGVLSIIILLTGSRMGIFLLLFVIVVTVLLNFNQIERSSLFVIVFGISLIVFLFSASGQAVIDYFILRNEYLARADNFSNNRFDLWAQYFSVFNSDITLWFIGLGDFNAYGIDEQAHNFLLEDIASYGLIGVSLLYYTYIKIYVKQFRIARVLNRSKMHLFTIVPFLVPIIGGLTLHGLTNIINSTMLFLGVLCMSCRKR